jgi:hypothetical protein|nr:MAG TPA: hypothetical protein [Caudoviricetes sp.]
MKQNIILKNFLRSLPEGAMLYCPLLGWVKIAEVNASGICVVSLSDQKDNESYLFRDDAHLANFEQGEPMLLPSVSCRSWDVLDFNDGDIVAVDILSNSGKMKTYIMKFKGLSFYPFFTVHYYLLGSLKTKTLLIDQEMIINGSYSRERLIIFRYATETEEEKFKAKVEKLNLQI